jgi:hypothetical protein
MQDEGFVARESVITLRIFIRVVIRRFGSREVRDIEASPFFLPLVPPN